MSQDKTLEKLQKLSDAMEEDRIEISSLTSWDIDFLKSMSINYPEYKAGIRDLTEKQIAQIDRIYSEHLGD